MNQFILAAVANQLATWGGRKVALVLESDLTAAVEPEGFCAACRQCCDAEDVLRLPIPSDKLRQTVDRGAPTDATCPAGLAFLAAPLAIGPARVIGYLAVGHVADAKALEERLLALAQEWARSLALLYLTVSAREHESALAATVHALGELSEAVDSGDFSACGQVLARWAARCTGGTAAVFVPDERREPKLLAHSAGDGPRQAFLGACRWLARQALARRATMTASSDLLSKEEDVEGAAGLVVAHPLGTGSRVLAVLAVAWPREEGDRALGDHREVLATVARIGGALLNALAQRQEMAEAHAHAVQLLVTALEARFPWLSGHASRTARLARAMALALGLGLPETEEVYEAALLHDVGHLRADAEFLDNPAT